MKPSGPLIFIGMPAATKGASGAHFYRPPAELTKMYQVRGRWDGHIHNTQRKMLITLSTEVLLNRGFLYLLREFRNFLLEAYFTRKELY